MCCCVDMNAVAGHSSVCGEVSVVHILKKKKLTLPKQNKKPLMDFNSCRNRHAPYADVYPKQSLLQTCIHIHLRTDGLG